MTCQREGEEGKRWRISTAHFSCDGAWVAPEFPNKLKLTNPGGMTSFAAISLGSAADCDLAAAAARAAFPGWSATSREQRLAKLEKLAEVYERRSDEMAKAISQEMGAPITLATRAQARAGLGHIKAFIAVLKDFEFEHSLRDDARNEHIVYEPSGVCGMITPWTWPMNQVTLKVEIGRAHV